MSRVILNTDTTFELDSDTYADATYYLEINGDVTLVIKLTGNLDFQLKIDAVVTADSTFKMLLMNNINSKLIIEDQYDLYQGAQGTIAYCQMNSAPVVTDSVYNLKGQQAAVRSLTVSITAEKNVFQQTCNHLAGQTKGDIDNFGIVLANGNCEMIVKNSINKGFHDCKTHQTSRLLTYDKTSVGNILPILYIDDDQVEASHACSLGQPDEEQIYYLQTRGLTYQQALRLISIGYLMPITKIVDDAELNDLIKNEIETKVTMYV